MKPQDEVEWNEEELESLAALEREREPDRSLEERTVARLRREGLIRRPEESRGRFRRVLFPAFPVARLGWASAAAALLAAVFFAGMAVGERWAVRSTAEALANFHEDNLKRASARVQQTGSAYVSALAALGQLAAGTADPQDLSQGREAALAALYAAATELVRLDPDDPVATRILQGLEEIRKAGSKVEAPGDAKRQVVWF